MTTKRVIPVVQYEYEPGEWTEPMTTDVLVEQFDCGEHTEGGLDSILATVPVGTEVEIRCSYPGAEPGWTMNLRRTA